MGYTGEPLPSRQAIKELKSSSDDNFTHKATTDVRCSNIWKRDCELLVFDRGGASKYLGFSSFSVIIYEGNEAPKELGRYKTGELAYDALLNLNQEKYGCGQPVIGTREHPNRAW